MVQQFRVWSGSEEFKLGESYNNLEEAREFARKLKESRGHLRVHIKDEETGELIETMISWANNTFRHAIEDISRNWRKRTIEFTDKDGNTVEAQFHSKNEEEYYNSTYKLSGNVYVPIN